jgi:hypothetical protein
MEDLAAWQDWALGKREIPESAGSPSLDSPDFGGAEVRRRGIDPGEFKLFTRRLSRLSKMTIRVIYELLPLGEARIAFISFRGEIGRQFTINQTVIQERAVMPAAFSLSVFNTPPAAAAVALKLHAGYTALYPGNGRFGPGLLAAAAPVLSGAAEEVLLVYADETPPPEYGALRPPCRPPAFAALLSRLNGPGSVALDADAFPDDPGGFLRLLIQAGAPWGGLL